MYADILIYNGKCLSVEENKTYDWVAIKKEKIVRMGYGGAFEKELKGYEIGIDAKGGSVLPGFYDSNFHFVQTALDQEGVYLGNVKSFTRLARSFARNVKRNPACPSWDTAWMKLS